MKKTLLFSLIAAMTMTSVFLISCATDDGVEEEEKYVFNPAIGNTTPPKMKNGYNKGIGLYRYRALVQIGEPVTLYAKRFREEQLVEKYPGCRLTDVKWWSENEKIAKVDETTGVVTGVSAGYVYIYAYNEDGCAARCYVKVEPKSAKYGIAVAGYELTGYNYKDVDKFPGVKGGISFEPKDSILTLNSCNITLTDSVEGIYVYKEHIRIYNFGKSKIKTNHTSAFTANVDYYGKYKTSSVLLDKLLFVEIAGDYWRTTDDKLTLESRGFNGSYDVGSGLSISGGTVVEVSNIDLEIKGAQAGCSGFRYHDYSGICLFPCDYYPYYYTDFKSEGKNPVAWPSAGLLYLKSCRLTATCDDNKHSWGCLMGSQVLVNEVDKPADTDFMPVTWEKGSILWPGITALCKKGTNEPVKGTVIYEDSRPQRPVSDFTWTPPLHF